MKILYFDCFSGISGDMVLGAMADAGVDIKSIKKELKKLAMEGYDLKVSKVKRKGIKGTRVDVVVDKKKHFHHTSYKDIKRMIERSRLSKKIKEDSLKIFKNIAVAEAKIHRTSVDNVHFHEVGAVDSIVDVVGAAICINLLSPDIILSSPINTGRGMVKTEHGILPVPAPATAEMLRGFPSYSSNVEFELATPTGVGIITTMSKSSNTMPNMKTNAIGYGAGSKDFSESPNLLRIMIGEGYSPSEQDSITVIESNIDDMNPQFYDHIINILFKGGALDVFLTPIIMKKNRPAVKITVLSKNDSVNRLADILLSETTSFGLRMYNTERVKLEKEIKTIKTEYGNVRVKIGKRKGAVISITPEYEDCKKIAEEKGMPIKYIYEKVKASAKQKHDFNH
ncbi:MAG: nickel pincer cofactor biosynthesis protein LarC [Nitrospinae bacterium]|nr:nickel pincer cofactor biosynthesis protein LarC [Nitrospinota bacterium]